MENNFRKIINSSNRIVLKVGSSILMNQNSGEININWLTSFANDLLKMLNNNKKVLVVS